MCALTTHFSSFSGKQKQKVVSVTAYLLIYVIKGELSVIRKRLCVPLKQKTRSIHCVHIWTVEITL